MLVLRLDIVHVILDLCLEGVELMCLCQLNISLGVFELIYLLVFQIDSMYLKTKDIRYLHHHSYQCRYLLISNIGCHIINIHGDLLFHLSFKFTLGGYFGVFVHFIFDLMQSLEADLLFHFVIVLELVYYLQELAVR